MTEQVKEAINSTKDTLLSFLYDIQNLEAKKIGDRLTVISPLRADEHLVSLGLAKKIFFNNFDDSSYYSSISLAATDCRTCQPYFQNSLGVSTQKPYFPEIFEEILLKDLPNLKIDNNKHFITLSVLLVV